ncbi:hypothetical protein SLA2020_261260 [Shorea laevis]
MGITNRNKRVPDALLLLQQFFQTGFHCTLLLLTYISSSSSQFEAKLSRSREMGFGTRTRTKSSNRNPATQVELRPCSTSSGAESKSPSLLELRPNTLDPLFTEIVKEEC